MQEESSMSQAIGSSSLHAFARLDRIGLSSHALQILQSTSEIIDNNNNDEIKCLRLLYENYCVLLYRRCLPALYSFENWICLNDKEKVTKVIDAWMNGHSQLSLEKLYSYLEATLLMDGSNAQKAFNLLSQFSYTISYTNNSLDNNQYSPFNLFLSVIETILISNKDNISLLDSLASLGEASAPTLPRPIISELKDLIRLVTRVCLVYDDTDRGLSFMWRLISATPKACPGLDADMTILDDIEQALSVCDICLHHLTPPPLHCLLSPTTVLSSQDSAYVANLIHSCSHLAISPSHATPKAASDWVFPLRQQISNHDNHKSAVTEAIFLRMCYQLNDSNSQTFYDIFASLVSDATELLLLKPFAHISPHYMGTMIFRTMLALCPYDCIEATIDALLSISDEDDYWLSIRDKLLRLQMHNDYIQQMLFDRARDLFDSASSSYSKELDHGMRLLARISTDSLAVNTARAFYDFIDYARQLDVHIVPRQLTKSTFPAATAVQLILEQLPSAYLNIDCNSTHLNIAQDENETNYTLPGSSLINAAAALGDQSAASTLAMLIVLVKFTIKLADPTGAFQVLMQALHLIPDIEDDYMVIADEALEVAEAVLGLMDLTNTQQLEFHNKISSSIISYCPQTHLNKYADALLKKSVQEYNAVSRLEFAHNIILKMFGVLLLDNSDSFLLQSNLPSPEEVVHLTTGPTLQCELIGYLQAIDNKALALDMLEKRRQDIERKMQSAIKMADSDEVEEIYDESIVQHLVRMGFHRNGAIRAAISGKGDLDHSVAWAIDHSGDKWFTDPISLVVSGALLKPSSGMECKQSNLEKCLEVIRNGLNLFDTSSEVREEECSHISTNTTNEIAIELRHQTEESNVEINSVENEGNKAEVQDNSVCQSDQIINDAPNEDSKVSNSADLIYIEKASLEMPGGSELSLDDEIVVSEPAIETVIINDPILSPDDKLHFLRNSIDSSTCFTSQEFSNLTHILRKWEVSVFKNIESVLSEWTKRSCDNLAKRKVPKKSFDLFRRECFEIVLDAMKKARLEDNLLNFLFIDVDIFNWGYSFEVSPNAGPLASPAALIEWADFVTPMCKLNIEVAIGGIFAEKSLLSVEYINQIDSIYIMLAPLTVPHIIKIVHSPLWQLCLCNSIDRLLKRISSRPDASVSEFSDYRKSQMNNMTQFLSEVNSPEPKFIPLVFHPIFIIGTLIVQGHINDALHLYWHVSCQPMAGYDIHNSLVFLDHCVDTLQHHFCSEYLVEVNSRLYGWNFLDDIHSQMRSVLYS